MAIAQMSKVMVVTHRSQASELLETLQREGICQVLNAEEAMVSKDMPELAHAIERPRNIEQMINRLQKTITFLKKFAKHYKGLVSILSPRAIVDQKFYNEIIADADILIIVEQAEQLEASIEKTKSEIENLNATLEMIMPWKSLQTPVEQIGRSERTASWVGLIPVQQLEQMEQQIAELPAAVQQVDTVGGKVACVIIALNEDAEQVQKLLRSVEFEAVSFESFEGTVPELILQHSERLKQVQQNIETQIKQVESLSKNLLKLQVLYDHYNNLLTREQAKDTAPTTEHTVVLEGWVKKHDYSRLERLISDFQATSMMKVQAAEGEEIPVEIENKKTFRPFEVITRLYGMPQYFEVDPTAFLAPFFAIFFGLCLTDAGYGLVIVALMFFLIKKVQGDKKLMWMLGICAAVTIVAGALTGGWFGDAIQKFIPALEPLRRKMIWFDPLENPMIFFKMSLALGYFQIMFGLMIAFIHNLKQRDYVAAICDRLTWLIMLNSIVLFLASKFGVISGQIGRVFGIIAIFPAIIILLFSHREGCWPGRIGMGLYNLFSTIFYLGDVLSYLRLMALGMVTAGLAMAINVIAEIAGKIPYGIGIIAMLIVFVGGHLFNLAINALGAFVHTLRLQYVEFFPKFFVGGGKVFEPLSKKYEHIHIVKDRA